MTLRSTGPADMVEGRPPTSLRLSQLPEGLFHIEFSEEFHSDSSARELDAVSRGKTTLDISNYHVRLQLTLVVY